ncbi:MAG: hypothetical protein ACI9ZH_001284 [Paracoccaceae bacterium]|jgi:hypothetical protein
MIALHLLNSAVRAARNAPPEKSLAVIAVQ